MKRYRIVYPAILGVLVVFLGAWSLAPHGTAPFQVRVQMTQPPSPTSRPLPFPGGMSEDQMALLQSLYDFNPDISAITPGSLVGSDRTALDVMWAQNTNVLQMLRVALDRARNADLRANIRLFYQMRLKDQMLLDQMEAQVGPPGETQTPGPILTIPVTATAVTVIPTNLPTPVDTLTGTPPTEVATSTPYSTLTAVPTSPFTMTPYVTSTAYSTLTAVPTSPFTMTPYVTSTAYETETPGPTMPVTMTPYETSTAVPTETPGVPIQLNNVPILPGTALGQLGFTRIDLTEVFLNTIKRVSSDTFDLAFVTQMNAALNLAMDTAREVQSTSANPVLQDVATHMAQEDQLDLLMLQMLGDKIFFGQSLIVRFPPRGGGEVTPTPASTESFTPVPFGTATPTPVGTEIATPVPSQTATALSEPSGLR